MDGQRYIVTHIVRASTMALANRVGGGEARGGKKVPQRPLSLLLKPREGFRHGSKLGQKLTFGLTFCLARTLREMLVPREEKSVKTFGLNDHKSAFKQKPYLCHFQLIFSVAPLESRKEFEF